MKKVFTLNVGGILGTYEDITKRKRVEEALWEGVEQCRTITNTAQDAIIMMDNEGKIAYWNPAAERMFGYTLEEKNRRVLHTLLAPRRYYKAYKKGFKKFQKTGQGIVVGKTLELSAFRKDGTEFPIELSVSAIKIKGKWHATGIIRDITKRKQAEKALMKARDELEQRVKERTAELLKANEQLKREIEERKQAEKEKQKIQIQLLRAQKMQAIGTLAGGIAHDFNNILSVIQGNAQLVSMKLDPKSRHYNLLKCIENQVDAGAVLTRQLLGCARDGKYEVKPINLNDVLQETLAAFGRTKKEVAIHQKLQNDVPPIEADKGQIEQVLMNLYVNAAHAMPDGGDLYLETRVVTHEKYRGKPFRAEAGNYVVLSVTDTGTGMDNETMERIFDPFFTTKEIGRGTGLGLASVYGIVKSHKGYIDVVSEKGHGTTFEIYFPLSKKKVVQPVRIAEDVVKGTETILLVDDEETVLNMGAEILNSLGYTVLEATNGREALNIYATHKEEIDLIILDMIMPDMGGGKVYDFIRGINSNAKVLLASGYSLEGQAAAILERGCNAFIQKPFSIEHLSQKLREVLDKKERKVLQR